MMGARSTYRVMQPLSLDSLLGGELFLSQIASVESMHSGLSGLDPLYS